MIKYKFGLKYGEISFAGECLRFMLQSEDNKGNCLMNWDICVIFNRLKTSSFIHIDGFVILNKTLRIFKWVSKIEFLLKGSRPSWYN